MMDPCASMDIPSTTRLRTRNDKKHIRINKEKPEKNKNCKQKNATVSACSSVFHVNVFFANAPQLRKTLLKFGKRWRVVCRARHRRQLSVVIALSQEIGIFTWHLIKPLLHLLAPWLIRLKIQVGSLCGGFTWMILAHLVGKVYFLQVFLFCQKRLVPNLVSWMP